MDGSAAKNHVQVSANSLLQPSGSLSTGDVLLKQLTSILQKVQLNIIHWQQKKSITDNTISLDEVEKLELWSDVGNRRCLSKEVNLNLAGDVQDAMCPDEYSKRIRLASLNMSLYREFRAWVCKFGAESHSHVVRKPLEIFNDISSSQSVLAVLTWLSKVQLQKQGRGHHQDPSKRGIYMRLCEQLAKYFIAGGDMNGLKDWVNVTMGQIDAYKSEMKNSKGEFKPLHESPENSTNIKTVTPLDWFVHHKNFDQLLWPYLCAEIMKKNNPSQQQTSLESILQNKTLVSFLGHLLRSWSLMQVIENAMSSNFDPCVEASLRLSVRIRDVIQESAEHLVMIGINEKDALNCMKTMTFEVVSRRHEFMSASPSCHVLAGLLSHLQQRIQLEGILPQTDAQLMSVQPNVPGTAEQNCVTPAVSSQCSDVAHSQTTPDMPTPLLQCSSTENNTEETLNIAVASETNTSISQESNSILTSRNTDPLPNPVVSSIANELEASFSPSVDSARDAALDSIIARALDCLNSYSKTSEALTSLTTTAVSTGCVMGQNLNDTPSSNPKSSSTSHIISVGNNHIPSNNQQISVCSSRNNITNQNSAIVSLQSYVQHGQDNPTTQLPNCSSSYSWSPAVNHMAVQPHPNFPFEHSMVRHSDPSSRSSSNSLHASQTHNIPNHFYNVDHPAQYPNLQAAMDSAQNAQRYLQQSPVYRASTPDNPWFPPVHGSSGCVDMRVESSSQCMLPPQQDLRDSFHHFETSWSQRNTNLESGTSYPFSTRVHSQNNSDQQLRGVVSQPRASLPAGPLSPPFNSNQNALLNRCTTPIRTAPPARLQRPGFPHGQPQTDNMFPNRQQTRGWIPSQPSSSHIPLSQAVAPGIRNHRQQLSPQQASSISLRHRMPHVHGNHLRGPGPVTRRSRSASATAVQPQSQSSRRNSAVSRDLPPPTPLNLPFPDMTVNPIVIVPQEDSCSETSFSHKPSSSVSMVKPEPSKRRRFMSDTTVTINLDNDRNPTRATCHSPIVLDDEPAAENTSQPSKGQKQSQIGNTLICQEATVTAKVTCTAIPRVSSVPSMRQSQVQTEPSVSQTPRTNNGKGMGSTHQLNAEKTGVGETRNGKMDSKQDSSQVDERNKDQRDESRLANLEQATKQAALTKQPKYGKSGSHQLNSSDQSVIKQACFEEKRQVALASKVSPQPQPQQPGSLTESTVAAAKEKELALGASALPSRENNSFVPSQTCSGRFVEGLIYPQATIDLRTTASSLSGSSAGNSHTNPEYVLMDEVYLADALFNDGDVKGLLDWDTSDSESIVSARERSNLRVSSLNAAPPIISNSSDVSSNKAEPPKASPVSSQPIQLDDDDDVELVIDNRKHQRAESRNEALSPRSSISGSSRRASRNSVSPVRASDREISSTRRKISIADESGRSNMDDGYLSDEEHIVLRVRKKDFVNIDLETGDFEVFSPNFSPRSRWTPRLAISPGRTYSDDNGSLPELSSSPESITPNASINIDIPASSRSPRQRRRTQFSPRPLPVLSPRGPVFDTSFKEKSRHTAPDLLQPAMVVQAQPEKTSGENLTDSSSSPDVVITGDNLGENDVIVIGDN